MFALGFCMLNIDLTNIKFFLFEHKFKEKND